MRSGGRNKPRKKRKEKKQKKKGSKKENPTKGKNMSSEATGWTAVSPH